MSDPRPISESDHLAINDPIAIARLNSTVISEAILLEAVKFYAAHGSRIKNEINQIGAEIHHRQDKVKFFHGLIQDINNLINNNETLDISKNVELQDKLKQAKELGVNLPMDEKSTEQKPLLKTTFTSAQRDRLLENIHLTVDEMDKEGKIQTQKMQVLIQESDRYLTLANQVMKYEDKPKRTAIAAIK